MEEWKILKGFNNQYKISNYGKVIKIKEIEEKNGEIIENKVNKILNTSINLKKTVERVPIHINNVRKFYSVSRLVYINFVDENLKDTEFIKHKDGNHLNHYFENLYIYEKKVREPKVKKVKKVREPKVKNKKVKELKKLKEPKVKKQIYEKQYNKGNYIKNTEMLYQFLLSKGKGKPTDLYYKMLYQIASGIHFKLNRNYNTQYRDDILTDVYIHLLKNFNKFNEKKYDNIVAYYSEIAKRACTEYYNREKYKTKNYITFGKNRFISLSDVYNY